MKIAKKTLALMLALVMLVSYLPTTVFAAGGETNLTYKLSATEVNVGDEVSVTIGVKAMEVSSFACGIDFDNTKLEVTNMTKTPTLQYEYYDEDIEDYDTMKVPTTSYSTIEEANRDGHVGAVWAGSNPVSYDKKATLVKITFIAEAPGTVNITVFEDSSGPDACKKNPVGTLTLIIKGNEPEPPAHECTPGAVSYEKGTNGKHTKIVACADNCGLNYSETEEFCSGGTADCEHAATCAYCGNTYGEAKGHGKTNGFRYVHNDGTDTHDVICNDCQKTVEEDVACTFENGSHVCKFACGNETDCTDGNNDHNCDVCGTELSKCSDKTGDKDHKCDVCGKDNITQCADGNNDHNCDECGTELSKCSDKTGDKNHNCDVCGKPGISECAGGTATCLNPAVCSECGEEYGDIDPENHVGNREIKYNDNGDDHTKIVFYPECEHVIDEINEAHSYGDDFICDNCEHELAGWVEMDGNWYYVVDGEPVTGITRVPYPTAKINGVTYAANPEDVAYAESHAGSKYSDAETARFIFAEDGKFQYNFTGIVEGNRYAYKGMIGWHYGLAKIDGEYYYFIGDVNGGGNIAAEGDTRVTRPNGISGIEAGAVYNFASGKLSGADGIVDGKFYQASKLMKGLGMTEVAEGYIYVRSTGELAIGQYWVTNTNGLCNAGMYNFGTDGILQSAKDPNTNGIVDGYYYKNGMPYYAGLIEIDGATYYVNASGKVVTGKYYVTRTDKYTGSLDIKPGDLLIFGEDGKMEPIKNGICEKSGVLYFYENNHVKRNAGVVKMTDENGETFYIYVRSNGQLATGLYWPTNLNGLLERGEYDWGTDGRYYPSK